MPRRDGDGRSSPLATALRVVALRLLAAAVLRAAAVAVCAGAAVATVTMRLGASPVGNMFVALTTAIAAAGGAAIWLRFRREAWTPAAAARAIERTQPNGRNVVITAEELLRHPHRARPWMQMRVLNDATAFLNSVRASDVVPLRHPAIVAIVASGLAVAVVAGLPPRAASRIRQAVQRGYDGQAVTGLTIGATIIAPDYTGERPRTLENPNRIDAVQGSRLRLELRTSGTWRVRFGSEPLPTSQASNVTVAHHTLSTSGYLAIEPIDATAAAARRLIPIAVTPDRAPALRLDAPGKDLLLPDVRSAVAVAATATDDYGLRSLELRYTRASGSGEQFEFQEGSIPLAIDRESQRSWKARADVALASLGLEPGDALVYRVVARDARPGDEGLASSDTFVIEIAGPGQVALEGFELPPDRERYALSQQMIVLKIERLRAREATLPRVTLEEEAANIAAEQRAVRANFVFLMGGHVEDEEVEAEQSHEIQEGRLENTARKEIFSAIQHMSRSEQRLAAVSTSAALPPARAAVEALQRAFGRNRYILRTLPVRSRIDSSRRLSGEISGASDWSRERRPAEVDRRAHAARALLARLLELVPAIRSRTTPPRALSALAEEALAVDPASQEWQEVSTRLLHVRDALAGGRSDPTGLVNAAIAPLVTFVQQEALAPGPDRRQGALRSAWAEARRPR